MVAPGTLFDYLAAFITIVLALALGDLLVSLHRLLRARRKVSWAPLPALLATFVGLSLLTIFFGIWDMTRWDRLNFYGLIWQVVMTMPLFLAACAVLPDNVPEGGINLDTFYFEERRYITTLLITGLLLDVVNQIVFHWHQVRSNPTPYITFYLPVNIMAISALAVIGLSRRKLMHWVAYAVIFGAAHMGYSIWEIRGASAVVQ